MPVIMVHRNYSQLSFSTLIGRLVESRQNCLRWKAHQMKHLKHIDIADRDPRKIQSKCFAFAGDNANVNFGGINRKDGKNGKNVFSQLKVMLKKPLVGLGCPAHVLHNCIQHGADLMPVDVEAIVLKVFNYFAVYTVRTEALKDFCEFVDVNYQQLLYHSKTRWLSLFPAIERMLQLFPALKLS